MSTAEKFDPYQAITDQIIALLEAGTAAWRKPWNAETGMPKSLTTGKAYRGINPFLLHISAMEHGFTSPYWATYKAIAERGGQVRKGEKGTLIVFWKSYPDKTETDKNGNPKQRFVLRTYRVFNSEQADNLAVPEYGTTVQDHDPIAECETAIAPYLSELASVSREGTSAHYMPATDALTVPPLSSFGQPEEFYSTLFHELSHSTGHTSRLNRPSFTGHVSFGDQAYSKEELVAEMGAAMLAGQTGIAPVTLENSAAYLASWLKVLKADNKLVVQAAAQAQRAVDLVFGVTFQQQTEAA